MEVQRAQKNLENLGANKLVDRWLDPEMQKAQSQLYNPAIRPTVQNKAQGHLKNPEDLITNGKKV